MQIIISIIFLHLWPGRPGNRAFPLSGSVRLQLVGILVPEPDGLAMLRHMFNKQACAQPASQRHSFQVARYARIYIFTWCGSSSLSPHTSPAAFRALSLPLSGEVLVSTTTAMKSRGPWVNNGRCVRLKLVTPISDKTQYP